MTIIMITIIILAAVGGVVLLALAVNSYNKTQIQKKEQALARYEKVKNGELSEADLNEQEKTLLEKLRAEKTCGDIDYTQLLLWAVLMHNHNVLPQNIVQPYEVDLQTSYPQVYETYQQCYNNYCYYNSGGSYSGYSSYSSY